MYIWGADGSLFYVIKRHCVRCETALGSGIKRAREEPDEDDDVFWEMCDACRTFEGLGSDVDEECPF